MAPKNAKFYSSFQAIVEPSVPRALCKASFDQRDFVAVEIPGFCNDQPSVRFHLSFHNPGIKARGGLRNFGTKSTAASSRN